MIAQRPPSYQRTYDTYYSGDPSFAQLADDATKEQAGEYVAKITVAHDTGDWSALLVPGGAPTKFVLQQIDRNVWRAITDRAVLPPENPRWIGPVILPSLLLRLALQSIPGWDVEVSRKPDPSWGGWVMAQPDIVTMLDEIDTGIVGELGAQIFRRLQGVSSK